MLEIVFLTAAVIGGTIMVCQFILTIIGIDGDGGLDAGGHAGLDAGMDVDGGSFDSADGVGHAATHDANLAGADHSHPDTGKLFSVLSFRTLVAAATFFGIAGETMLSAGAVDSVSLVVALLVGFAAMYGMYWLLGAIASFASSGNERIGNALGKTAYVYVAIPSNGKGAGKVQLSMQNRIVEYPALTDDSQSIASGESVTVVDLIGNDTLKVRRTAAHPSA